MSRLDRTAINPIVQENRKIYAYTIPQIPERIKYVKVGETSGDVAKRIRQQLGTAGLKEKLYFTREAKHINGKYFRDTDLHRFFLQNGVDKEDFGTSANEWFFFNGHPERAEELTDKYINFDYSTAQISSDFAEYTLRNEQNEAVEKTIKYFNKTLENEALSREFLWNAKPRFGKTLTTYDLIRRLKLRNILIVTNRPAIANSWYDDFEKFISWQYPKYIFVSESDSITREGPITRKEYADKLMEAEEVKIHGSINFFSLQDLKGSIFAGGPYAKNEWVKDINWDLLVIDEAHEGVETFKTYKLFEKINRKFTLHLSGTPFKALKSNKFDDEQIFNWSYADEQRSKNEWYTTLDTNPYKDLPTLSLFTYKMGAIIEDKL